MCWMNVKRLQCLSRFKFLMVLLCNQHSLNRSEMHSNFLMGPFTASCLYTPDTQYSQYTTGWWWLEHLDYVSTYWECHPNWLSYFSEGLKPPTRQNLGLSNHVTFPRCPTIVGHTNLSGWIGLNLSWLWISWPWFAQRCWFMFPITLF